MKKMAVICGGMLLMGVAGAYAMGGCMGAVDGASYKVENTKDGVVITVTAKDAAAVKKVQATAAAHVKDGKWVCSGQQAQAGGKAPCVNADAKKPCPMSDAKASSGKPCPMADGSGKGAGRHMNGKGHKAAPCPLQQFSTDKVAVSSGSDSGSK